MQEAVDQQVAHIASEAFDWIFGLPMHSEYKFEYAGEEFEGIIQFLPKEQKRASNSFMLGISRALSPGVYKHYISGFLFDKDKVIKYSTDELELSTGNETY